MNRIKQRLIIWALLASTACTISCADEDTEPTLDCDRSVGQIAVATVDGVGSACSYVLLKNYQRVTGTSNNEEFERITIEFTTPATSYIVTIANFESVEEQGLFLTKGLGLFETDVTYEGSAKSRSFDQSASMVFTKLDREAGLFSGNITGAIISEVSGEGVAAFSTVRITLTDLNISLFQ